MARPYQRKEIRMKRFEIPELLAPVGGWEQLRAAVQNGADAVYMGGPQFNARIKAENFTYDDMRAAIEYAHDRNVRVYVTLTTRLKDSELKKAFSYVGFLYEAGADAVIIQDLGLARLVRKYLPEMPMHMSTQGTIYNERGAVWTAKAGFSRIVPARELTLEEIKRFARACHEGENPCEVEIFVHGAMCICYSGQCHMSRVLGGGGRSGNRGLCAQPCRLPYEDERGRRGYFLSPGDMCALELLPEICRAGVDSLKIEGRLKSPQYVAVVTSVYRKYLDMYGETGKVRVSDEDMVKLMSIFNRGGFCGGYFRGNPGEALLSGETPKNRGIYAGRVVSAGAGGTLVDIRPEADPKCAGTKSETPLRMGDGVEIRGSGVTGNVITYMKDIGGGLLRIGDIRERVAPGDRVYRVTERQLLDEAERSYDDDNGRKVPVHMRFAARKGRAAQLFMSEGNIEVEASSSAPVEEAINRPLDAERIRKQLSKLGETFFEAVDIDVETDGDIAMAISEINAMRRAATCKLVDERRRAFAGRRADLRQLAEDAAAEIADSENEMEANAGGRRGILVYAADMESLVQVLDGLDLRRLAEDTASGGAALEGAAQQGEGAMIFVPLRLYMEGARERLMELLPGGIAVVPYVSEVSKGNEDIYIEENFARIVSAVQESGIMLGNPGWIDDFAAQGVRIFGGHGFNVYNGQSLRFLREAGVDVRAYSLEADRWHRGVIPLMITEHPVGSGTLTDRKNVSYDVMRMNSGDKYLILGRERSKKDADSAFMTYVK